MGNQGERDRDRKLAVINGPESPGHSSYSQPKCTALLFREAGLTGSTHTYRAFSSTDLPQPYSLSSSPSAFLNPPLAQKSLLLAQTSSQQMVMDVEEDLRMRVSWSRTVISALEKAMTAGSLQAPRQFGLHGEFQIARAI